MSKQAPASTDATTQTTTSWFRSAAPYIHAHAGATFVIAMDGETIAGEGFVHLLHDIAILNSLDIHVVMAFGARPQIEAACQQRGIALQYHQNLRVTDADALEVAREVIGELRIDIEAELSYRMPHTPMADSRIRCISGNLVTARPIGILDGVDLGHTGEVRRVDTEAIQAQLALGNLVLLPPLGYSLTGEIFNLSSKAIATAVAVALKADKLIFVGQSNSGLPRELTLSQAKHHTHSHEALPLAIQACEAGIARVHLIDRAIDGALLQELFSRDGLGTLISASSFESIREATIEDVGGIIELIEPLEASGVMVKRSRELLECEITHFTVMERDGAVIGCAALYPYVENRLGELACLAISAEYRNQGRGQLLLARMTEVAKAQGLEAIVVLTTQTAHWFIEQGFAKSAIADLPMAKQAMYNYQRNSSVFKKLLN